MATKTYITPKFRCSFLQVFKAMPNEMKAGQPLEFSVTALFPKTADLSGLKQAWDEVIAAEKKITPAMRSDIRPLYSKHKDDKGMITDGDKKIEKADPEKRSKLDALRGHWSARLSASADHPPQVVDQHKQEILNIADFKSGDYARAVLELSSYVNKFGPQVSVRLLVIQKLADGESFGGGVSNDVALGMLDDVAIAGDIF